MNIEIIALIFVIMFIAELPDKSLFASLVLGSRFPGWYVWLGAASAFLVHVIIAVTAGHFLTLLPGHIHDLIVAALFFLGAGLIFFGKHGLEETPETKHLKGKAAHSFHKVFATSFGVVFIGEWGDITQIATANYAARYHDPFNVAVGATLGLWAVCAVAIILGTKLLSRIHPKTLQRITGVILLISGFVSLSSVFR